MQRRYVKAIVIDAAGKFRNGQVVTLDLNTYDNDETVNVVGKIGGWYMSRFGIDPVAKVTA